MVMTDRMLSMPNGLEHGVSIIEFESEVDLWDKILYYVNHKEERIEIAKRGREVAMRQHRTFHRVKQVVFGSEMSNCSSPDGGTQLDMQCPWTVHTVQTS
jgi:spore maturation protein CgeB